MRAMLQKEKQRPEHWLRISSQYLLLSVFDLHISPLRTWEHSLNDRITKLTQIRMRQGREYLKMNVKIFCDDPSLHFLVAIRKCVMLLHCRPFRMMLQDGQILY